MHDIAIQRADGVSREDAVREVTLDFDALAADKQDLANRRRVLETSQPLATFAFNLGDLRPETVGLVGEAYCLTHGSIALAPASSTTANLAANARRCEARSETAKACINEGIDVETLSAAQPVAAEAARPVAAEAAQPVAAEAAQPVAAEAAQPVAAEAARPVAGEKPRDRAIQPFFEFGLAFGGDTIGSIVFVNGEQEDIEAGNGLTFAGGVIQRINTNFGIKYTAGYKVSFAAADNADVIKSTLPIDIVPYYLSGKHRIGLGLSHHVSPKVDWDWLAPTTEFDDATGLTLEYAFRNFAFSYTDMDYETGNASFDASHFTFKYSSKY